MTLIEIVEAAANHLAATHPRFAESTPGILQEYDDVLETACDALALLVAIYTEDELDFDAVMAEALELAKSRASASAVH